jgi:hypothetical protein
LADLVANLASQVQIQLLDFSAAARLRPLSLKVRQLQRPGSLFALKQPGPPRTNRVSIAVNVIRQSAISVMVIGGPGMEGSAAIRGEIG